jgi:hypothetical protein
MRGKTARTARQTKRGSMAIVGLSLVAAVGLSACSSSAPPAKNTGYKTPAVLAVCKSPKAISVNPSGSGSPLRVTGIAKTTTTKKQLENVAGPLSFGSAGCTSQITFQVATPPMDLYVALKPGISTTQQQAVVTYLDSSNLFTSVTVAPIAS